MDESIQTEFMLKDHHQELFQCTVLATVAHTGSNHLVDKSIQTEFMLNDHHQELFHATVQVISRGPTDPLINARTVQAAHMGD